MQKVELIFLGTGDAFNTDGLAHSSVWVKTDTLNFLIDAGPTTLLQMISLNLDPCQLDYIFITHFHGDHTAGLPFIMLYLQKRMNSTVLPVIVGPVGIKECCISLFEAAYKDSELEKGLSFKEIEPLIHKNISINNKFSIDVYPMNHLPESIGYCFYVEDKAIAVSGDTGLNDSLLKLINNTDVAIIECSTIQPILPLHTSFVELSSHLPDMNAHTIIPVHTTKEILQKIKALQNEKLMIVTDKTKISL